MIIWVNGEIEVIKVSLEEANGTSLIKKSTGGFETSLTAHCVAISHVWADGMGNAQENALYECQIARLQILVNKLYPARYWPIPFWIDTFCIPVDDPETRKIAIAQMEWVYKSASKVLVLDRSLQVQSSIGMSEEEIGARIMSSGWARRLWTVQEGAMQNRVHYQFANKSHVYKDLNDAIQARHAFPHRQILLPEAHPLREILKNPPHCTSALSTLRQYAYKPLNPCWNKFSLIFKELDIDYGRTLLIDNNGRQARQISVLRVVQSRTTSKLEDETLVVATLLRRNPGATKEVINTPASERYKKIFSEAKTFPEDAIFLNTHRYQEEGYRWIPKTLLSQSAPLLESLPSTTKNSFINAKFGLQVSLRAFTVQFPPSAPSVPLQFQAPSSLFIIFEAGTGNYPDSISTCLDLAILLPNRVQYHYSKRGRGTDRYVAVLVQILNKAEIAARASACDRFYCSEAGSFKARHLALVECVPCATVESDVVSVATEPLEPQYLNDEHLQIRVG